MFSELTAAHTHNEELVALNGTLLVKIAQLEIERAHWKSQSEFEMRQATMAERLREDETRKQNEILLEENKNLRSTLDARKRDGQGAVATIDELNAKVETLKTNLQLAEQMILTRETRIYSQRVMKEEKAEMESKIATLERELRTYKADTKELEDELETLRKEEPTSVEYHRMEMDLEDMEEENAMLRHEITKIRRAHSEDVDTLKKSKDVMRNDLVTEHNRVVVEFKKSETKLVGECCEMSNKVAELKELVEHMRSAIACLSGLVGK
jgi:chromosome segregation ATPase